LCDVRENRAGRQYKKGVPLTEVEADCLFRFATDAPTIPVVARRLTWPRWKESHSALPRFGQVKKLSPICNGMHSIDAGRIDQAKEHERTGSDRPQEQNVLSLIARTNAIPSFPQKLQVRRHCNHA